MASVTVIIPVYNTEKYLPDCLESVLGQSLPDIEVIAVDDCSTDSSLSILNRYRASDRRLQVFHMNENRRQGACRNLGLEKAAGKYVYFLDSDDMIEKNGLEILLRTAEENAADGILFDAKAVYETPALEKRFRSFSGRMNADYGGKVWSGPALFGQLTENDDWNCYVQREFWSRDFLMRTGIRFPEGCVQEDEPFAFEAVLLARRIMHLPEEIFIRRFRENSVMTTPPSPVNLYGYLVCFYEMTAFVQKHGLKSEYTAYTIGKITDQIRRLYRKLKNSHDLEKYMIRPEIRDLFVLYDTAQDAAAAYYKKYSAAFLHEARKYRHVFIYGAGIIAEKVFSAMVSNDTVVDGFIVSSREGNPDVLHGRRVIPLAEFEEEPADTLVIVSVTTGYRNEIEELLDKRGIRHIYYK